MLKALAGSKAARLAADPGNILSIACFIALMTVWELGTRFGYVAAYLLPPPSEIVVQMGRDITSPIVQRDIYTTISEILIGLTFGAMLGVSLGAAIALFPLVEKVVWPYIVTMQTIPKIAVAPLIIIWAGFGIQSKILIVMIICFFPILVNAVAGFKGTDSRQILLMQIIGANAWQTFIKVRLPQAVPFLIAGFRIAVVLAVIGAVVGEFLGATHGVGSLIIRRQAEMKVSGVFSAVFILSIVGLTLNFAVKLAARKYAFWAETSNQLNT